MSNAILNVDRDVEGRADTGPTARKTAMEPLAYLAGFGNDLTSEALPGALPIGQNCVRKPPYGLYHEVINATSFTAPRKYNQRMHFYRLRPSVAVPELTPCDSGQFVSAPLSAPAEANPIAWDPFEMVDQPQDFLDGLVTLCANGSAAGRRAWPCTCTAPTVPWRTRSSPMATARC